VIAVANILFIQYPKVQNRFGACLVKPSVNLVSGSCDCCLLSIVLVSSAPIDNVVLNSFVGGYKFVGKSLFLAFDSTNKTVSFLIVCKACSSEDYGKNTLGNEKLHGDKTRKNVSDTHLSDFIRYIPGRYSTSS
jgi:hypothetical protein